MYSKKQYSSELELFEVLYQCFSKCGPWTGSLGIN